MQKDSRFNYLCHNYAQSAMVMYMYKIDDSTSQIVREHKHFCQVEITFQFLGVEIARHFSILKKYSTL